MHMTHESVIESHDQHCTKGYEGLYNFFGAHQCKCQDDAAPIEGFWKIMPFLFPLQLPHKQNKGQS